MPESSPGTTYVYVCRRYRHENSRSRRAMRSETVAENRNPVYILSIYIGRARMIVEFCKWGNSLAVRIPKTVADALKVSAGKRAEIRIENGTLVLRPIVRPSRKPRYTLDELLSGMT